MRDRRRPLSPNRQRALLRGIPRPDPADGFRPGEPLPVQRLRTGGDLLALDHVALAVADPAALAAFLCDHVGMHVLARDDAATVVGAAQPAARLTLRAAPGPRQPGALGRLILRVADVERAAAALPAETTVAGDRIERARFEGPEGLGLGFTLVAGGGIDYDLDHVVLRVTDPEQTRLMLAGLGFAPRSNSLHVADKYVRLVAAPSAAERPLLDHIAVRVESLEAVVELCHARGVELECSEAGDSAAVLLPGPEQLTLRFVAERSAARA